MSAAFTSSGPAYRCAHAGYLLRHVVRQLRVGFITSALDDGQAPL
jgi:hypothetical protein